MRLSNIKYTDDCETYQILGGEAVSIDLQSGDSVEVIDVEGDQQCSILAFDSKGSPAMDVLDWSGQQVTILQKWHLMTVLICLRRS